MAGLGVAAVVLMICFTIYTRVKKSSLDEDQSPAKQKDSILLRIGLFWGFWGIVGVILIIIYVKYLGFDELADTYLILILPIVGIIVIFGYVFFCSYQLSSNKKNIGDFNKKIIEAAEEEERQSVSDKIMIFIVTIIIFFWIY